MLNLTEVMVWGLCEDMFFFSWFSFCTTSGHHVGRVLLHSVSLQQWTTARFIAEFTLGHVRSTQFRLAHMILYPMISAFSFSSMPSVQSIDLLTKPEQISRSGDALPPLLGKPVPYLNLLWPTLFDVCFFPPLLHQVTLWVAYFHIWRPLISTVNDDLSYRRIHIRSCAQRAILPCTRDIVPHDSCLFFFLNPIYWPPNKTRTNQ